MLRDKKGDMPSILLGVILIMLFFFLLVGAFYMYRTFGSFMSGITFDDPQAQQKNEDLQVQMTNSGSALDGLFVVFFIILIVVLIISSYFIETHPIFFIFSLLIFLLFIPVSMMIGNFMEDLAENNTQDFINLNNDFPMSIFILTHFPIFILIPGIIILGILYMKRGG